MIPSGFSELHICCEHWGNQVGACQTQRIWVSLHPRHLCKNHILKSLHHFQLVFNLHHLEKIFLILNFLFCSNYRCTLQLQGTKQRDPLYPSASFPWWWSLAYRALTGAGAGEGQECGVGDSVSWSWSIFGLDHGSVTVSLLSGKLYTSALPLFQLSSFRQFVQS